MRHAVELVGGLNLVLFVGVALVCARQWRRERAVTALWATVAFVALAWVLLVARLLPDEPEGLLESMVARIDLAVLVLFPYSFYRFAAAFEHAPRPLARFVDSLSLLLLATTFALPSLPAEDEAWPWWFGLYAAAFVLHWSVLLLIVARRLWRGGRGEATVARRRMRMLALAATALTVALVLALGSPAEDSPVALVIGLLATCSGAAFLLGFAPPGWLRALWRRPEQARMQLATGELMAATTVDDVVARVLPPMASMVGASGIALNAPDGSPIGAHGTIDGRSGADVRRFDFPFGTVVVSTSTFAPFFGDEERKLLLALGSLTGLALDRARLFTQERDARTALERADQLKSEFVALAAHELRSPVGAIYGLSETIAEHGGRLPAERLAELQDMLTTQIRRLRELVEQLLDLSRLDAEAVTINPVRVRVREHLEAIVESVRPLESIPIGIDADSELEAEVDVAALERIVSNLIVNACRYGEPPIRVKAREEQGVLTVTVEDHGPGVPADFVPQLFERFARSARTAASSPGTGLGLAIARAYARAHSGEVSYRPAGPRGAAFELRLPAPA